MKKLIAFIFVLALCLSLCSVALATPAPVAPCSCNVNIIHAIGTYWIARTIVERAKEVKVETYNLSHFLKLALPVGVAAAAVTGGILYALLKGNGGKEDVKIETLGDLMELQTNFPADEDNGWAGSSKTSNKLYYAYLEQAQDTSLLVHYEHTWTGPLRTSELTPVANGYKFDFNNGQGYSFTTTFVVDAQNKITSITITGDSNVEDTYAPAE